jgi:hypothetical protein
MNNVMKLLYEIDDLTDAIIGRDITIERLERQLKDAREKLAEYERMEILKNE